MIMHYSSQTGAQCVSMKGTLTVKPAHNKLHCYFEKQGILPCINNTKSTFPTSYINERSHVRLKSLSLSQLVCQSEKVSFFHVRSGLCYFVRRDVISRKQVRLFVHTALRSLQSNVLHSWQTVEPVWWWQRCGDTASSPLMTQLPFSTNTWALKKKTKLARCQEKVKNKLDRSQISPCWETWG